MTNRELKFCFELANYMCYPNSIEIGGVSSQLKDIVKEITKGHKSIRKQVLEFCEEFISEGQFNANAYETSDEEEVLKMIKEDYNKIFFE